MSHDSVILPAELKATQGSPRKAKGWALLWPLVARDFKLRYQNSYVGLAWILVEPLLLVATLSGVFALLERGDRGSVPYPLYFYSAVLPWNLFRSALVSGAMSFVKDAPLLNNFDFAREIIIVKNWLVYFVEFCIASIGLLILVVLYGGGPSWTWLALGPVLAIQFALSIGIMLAVASLTVFIRDVGIFMSTLATLWFWATPIVFRFPEGGPADLLKTFNPMAGLIEAYRSILTGGPVPSLESLVPSLVASVLAVSLGVLTFWRTEARFSDVL